MLLSKGLITLDLNTSLLRMQKQMLAEFFNTFTVQLINNEINSSICLHERSSNNYGQPKPVVIQEASASRLVLYLRKYIQQNESNNKVHSSNFSGSYYAILKLY